MTALQRRVVHTVQIFNRPNYVPVFIAGEETPFINREQKALATFRLWVFPIDSDRPDARTILSVNCGATHCGAELSVLEVVTRASPTSSD